MSQYLVSTAVFVLYTGMSDDGESGLGAVTPIRLPLNSKRLTAHHLWHLAAELEVPTGASADELRQMIDGKLSEAGSYLE